MGRNAAGNMLSVFRVRERGRGINYESLVISTKYAASCVEESENGAI